MRVNVLGAIEVWRGPAHEGEPVNLGAPKPRSLVTALALSGGRAVSPDTLADLVWAGEPPDGVAGTLQAYVSGLRRALEPERPPRTPPTVLVSVPPGYALRLEPDAVDATRFAALVNGVRRRLGRRDHAWDRPALGPDEVAAALAELDEALGLWRGDPYLELGDAPTAVAERARLTELRVVALEDRAALRLTTGDHAGVAAELEALAPAYPVREQLWGLRAVALARSGRQAEALDVLAELRRVLDEELGLEPSRPLQALQTALLRQDPDVLGAPDLDLPAEPVTAPPAPATKPVSAAPVGWPLVGRDAQLASLVGRLDEALAGTPAFAAVTGDPGIGKTRLCAELLAVARARGVRVVVGRCSQDDGAPPLWPWQQVLTTLGADLDLGGAADEGAEFRSREAVVRRVHEAARTEPLVVVLDDLHWADTASLRVLRLLLETVHDGPLLLVATWRAHPEPTGALADVAESMARRHAARLALTGLGSTDVARIVLAVADVEASGRQAGELAERTDGNPFYLVEYARLARETGDLAGLLGGADPPTAVGDVLTRRLDRLPEPTARLLTWAAVAGREFELAVVAEASGTSEDEVLDALDAAVAAGLVREEREGGFVFTHALVRDTAYAALGPTRLARAHAAVAAALERRVGRVTEAARHWLAAGSSHADRAWRAAEVAAEQAREVHAHEQAVDLLVAALERLEGDPTATDEDRYRLLMTLADEYRWVGSWVPMAGVVEQAIEVAGRLDDVHLLAEASAHLAVGALWQTAAYAEQNERVVAALEESLRRLPPDDGELRCRVLMAMGSELYYVTPLDRRVEIAEEALAMARRLGSDQLVMEACEVAFVAQWSASTRRRRLELAVEAVALARRLGAERSLATATAMRANVEAELGRLDEMTASVQEVREQAGRFQLHFPLLFVEALLVSWAAMQDRFDDAERSLAQVGALVSRFEIHNADYGYAGALVSVRVWQERWDDVLPLFAMFSGNPLPIASTYIACLFRAGRVEQARAEAERLPIDLSRDDWYSPANWAFSAEAALGLGDAGLARAAYALLAPHAGTAVTAGSGLALGPADAFLALGAAAGGDRETAARHADAAEALMVDWRIPVCAAWFGRLRRRHDF
ncbi:BTAD domain-containing putative transcriptional regulator [Nocardioides bigeumensis]|uniref:BTAD domain-containing putative transcriptional regulator n=1 Tax=Nocardioides bigeumensis TaxID=433657 RepID=A0ABN2YXI4_9ACTN